MLEELGKSARRASKALAVLGQEKKNETLLMVAKALLLHKDEIIVENEKDIDAARLRGVGDAMLDRLRLTEDRFSAMAEGIRQVAALDDPIGEVLSMKERPNGLLVGQRRVPLGVIGMIYESRPNVTVDAFALCFKTGNAVILRGGSDAICSNKALVRVIRDALLACHVTPDAVSLITDTDRGSVRELIRMNEFVDVIIPRGGHGLIQNVVQNATVPVIETGTGNCHIYIDRDADLDMAVSIVHNAKLNRLGVCNACESLVVHREIAKKAIPMLVEDLKASECEMRGDDNACRIDAYIDRATREDFGTEYLAKIISVKVVEDLDEAIQHINRYSTGHSEAIITDNYQASMRFLNEIDSAAVYVNASTRFTDGFEFGFGAEIGISTQKLHARGPMGLLALTTTKYIIFGNGQIRE